MKKGDFEKFDLEAAKNGTPVRTKNGHRVKIFCYDRRTAGGYPIVGLILRKEEDTVGLWTAEGRFIGTWTNHKWDLVIQTKQENGKKGTDRSANRSSD